MGLITTLRSPPMSIVWSLLILGDRMQPRKENHPGKTFEAYHCKSRNRCWSWRFSNNFGNTCRALKLTRKDPKFPALAGRPHQR